MSSTYTLGAADLGKYLSVAVVATANGEDSSAAQALFSGPVVNSEPVIDQGDGALDAGSMSEDGSPDGWSAPALSATDANNNVDISIGKSF